VNSEPALIARGHLAILGGGVMGTAICRGVLSRHLVAPESVVVADTDPAQRARLHRSEGVTVVAAAEDALTDAALVVLAIKPQVYPTVATAIAGRVPESALVVSIMAGISLDRMRMDLAHEAVVRVMPNAAARVLESASVWIAAPGVSAAQRSQAERLLRALGDAVEVTEERFLDLATGFSGPGPAYLCLVAEALIEGGVAAGFGRALAQRLVYQTFVGTAALLSEPGAHPALVRESVTSPGGTTAAGLQALERSAVRAAFVDAVEAARRRSQELGNSQ